MSLAAAISTSGFNRSPTISAIHAVSRSLTFSLSGALKMFVGRDGNGGLERIVARLQQRNLLVAPQELAAPRQLEGLAFGRRHATGAHGEFLCQHVGGGIARGFAVNALGMRVGEKPEALQAAYEMFFDMHRAVVGDFGEQLVLLLEAAHQCAGAPVDEALRELLVQGVGKAVLDRARAGLPVLGVGEPVGSVGTKVQVRIWAMRVASVSISPSVRSAKATCLANQSSGMRCSAHDELVDRGNQLAGPGGNLAVVRNLANVPQPAYGIARRCQRRHSRIVADVFQRQSVVGHARPRRDAFHAEHPQAVPQLSSELKSSSRVRHCSDLDAVEGVRLQPRR